MDARIKTEEVKHYQEATKKQLKRGLQSRVFDGLSLLDSGSEYILYTEYKNILKQLTSDAEKLSEFKEISNIEYATVIEYVDLAKLLDGLNNVIFTDSNKKLLSDFITKLIKLACEKLLNGANQLRHDVIAYLDWEEFSENLIPIQIIASYVHHVLANLIAKICKEGKTGVQLTSTVANIFITKNYVPLIESYLANYQENDYYKKNISDVVKFLIKLSSPADLKALNTLIQEDLDFVVVKSNLYQKKYYFWLDVLYQYGCVYHETAAFRMLWDLLYDSYFCALDKIAENKYNQCKKYKSILKKEENTSEEKDKENSSEIEKFKKIVDQVTKNQVIDEIIKSYHNTMLSLYKKKDEKDFSFLKKLIKRTDDDEYPVKKLLYTMIDETPSSSRLNEISVLLTASFAFKIDKTEEPTLDLPLLRNPFLFK